MTPFPKVRVDTKPFNYNQTISHYTCVEKCEQNYLEVFNRCYKSEKGEKEDISLQEISTIISQDLVKTWPKILLTCFIAFVFSYIMLILFRYAIEYIIWIIYIGFVVFIGGLAIACWIWFATAKGDEKTSALVGGIVCTILCLVSILVLYWFRKRIQLVAQLFKEASKALIDVPMILFEPILTFLSLMFSIALFVLFIVLIQTAGKAMNTKNLDGTTHVSFVQDGGMSAANIVNIIAFIWFSQFIFGCQHFVIAGKTHSFNPLILLKY